MGVKTSGVRQIAEAVGAGDTQCIARTVTTLRRVAFCSGGLGALLLMILCKPVSRLTFGDDKHAVAVAFLALAVFFSDVSDGQAALVQGMRRISDLARMSIWVLWNGAQHPHRLLFRRTRCRAIPRMCGGDGHSDIVVVCAKDQG